MTLTEHSSSITTGQVSPKCICSIFHLCAKGGRGMGIPFARAASAWLARDGSTQRGMARKEGGTERREGEREVFSARQTSRSPGGNAESALHQWRLTPAPTHGGFPQMPSPRLSSPSVHPFSLSPPLCDTHLPPPALE